MDLQICASGRRNSGGLESIFAWLRVPGEFKMLFLALCLPAISHCENYQFSVHDKQEACLLTAHLLGTFTNSAFLGGVQGTGK